MPNGSKNLCERVADILKQEGLDSSIFKRDGDDLASCLDIDIEFEYELCEGTTYKTDPNDDGFSLLYDIYGGIGKEKYNKAESLGLIHPIELMDFQHSIALVQEDGDGDDYMALLSIDESGRLIKDADFAQETGIVDKCEPQYLKAGADFEPAFRVMVRFYKAHYSPTPTKEQGLPQK